MKVCIGPVAPTSAEAWIGWTPLSALAQDGPTRAAFVEQLRPSWPVAVDAH